MPRRRARAHNSADGIDRAQRVGNVGEGEELHRAVQQSIQPAQVQQPVVAGDGHVGQLGAGAFGQQLPGDDVAVMLHFGQQNRVAGLDVFGAPGVGDQVDAFGRSARENDFRRLAGVEEVRRALARRLVAPRSRAGSIRGCRDARCCCRCGKSGPAPPAPRAVFATWRRCQDKPADGRGLSGAGWENPRATRPNLSGSRSHQAQFEPGGLRQHVAVPGRVPNQEHRRLP